MEEASKKIENKELSGYTDSKVLYIVIGVLVFIVVCLSVAVGYLVLKDPERSDVVLDDSVTDSESVNEDTSDEIVSESDTDSDSEDRSINADPYDGWIMYTNENIGITYKYPSSWNIEEHCVDVQAIGCYGKGAIVTSGDDLGVSFNVTVFDIESMPGVRVSIEDYNAENVWKDDVIPEVSDTTVDGYSGELMTGLSVINGEDSYYTVIVFDIDTEYNIRIELRDNYSREYNDTLQLLLDSVSFE